MYQRNTCLAKKDSSPNSDYWNQAPVCWPFKAHIVLLEKKSQQHLSVVPVQTVDAST